MIPINKKTVIIKTLTGGEYGEEFAVGKDVHAVIVLLIRATGGIIAKPVIRLAGRGARATVLGIVLGQKEADIRMTTLQHHTAPDTASTLLIKAVMSGNARCTYEGSISVDKKAQKTDAYQRNENLLLSGTSHAVSKPALEILANDVRCTHGATVKTLDEDELWYMASRGIGKVTATRMITRGFLTSAADIIADPEIRASVADEMQKVYTDI